MKYIVIGITLYLGMLVGNEPKEDGHQAKIRSRQRKAQLNQQTYIKGIKVKSLVECQVYILNTHSIWYINLVFLNIIHSVLHIINRCLCDFFTLDIFDINKFYHNYITRFYFTAGNLLEYD